MKKSICFVLLILFSSSLFAATYTLTLGTGAYGWEYFKTGQSICSILNKSGNFKCAVLATKGSLDNLNQLKTGKINLALSQSDEYEVFIRHHKQTHFSILKTLYTQNLYILVKTTSDINTLQDIKNKIINVGPEGSGLFATMKRILMANHLFISNKLTYMPATSELNALCQGKIDVASYVLSNDVYSNLMRQAPCNLRLIPFNSKELMAINQNIAYQTTVFNNNQRIIQMKVYLVGSPAINAQEKEKITTALKNF